MKKPKRVPLFKLVTESERLDIGWGATEDYWYDFSTRERWSIDEIDGTIFTWCVDE